MNKNYNNSFKEKVEYLSMVGEVSLKREPYQLTKEKITGSEPAYRYFMNLWPDDIQIRESMYAMYLNRVNNVIGWAMISKGGLVGTVVDVRIIAKIAIEMLASGVIIAHNHPSGTIQPSTVDEPITKKIKEGLTTLDIQLLDHLILTKENYFSFADEGLL